jgi:hypothetical protein
MTDTLERVLKLVADGRLSAAEAAPILDALAAASAAMAAGAAAKSTADQAAAEAASMTYVPSEAAQADDGRPARFARIQVIEGGRRAVDLRVPISLGKLALARVPGLSGEHLSEVQDAIRTGSRGPILDIQDADGDGVRIVLE